MSKLRSYMKRALEPNERPVCEARLHWVYLASGVFWFSALAIAGWYADFALWKYFGQYIPRYAFQSELISFEFERNAIGIMFTACGAVIFATQFLRYVATGILVTTRRVIYKTGLINIRLDGTDISDIRGVHVDQGWIGRFLNYGKIKLDNRFITDVELPFIRDPYDVMRHIQKIKTTLEGRDEEFRAAPLAAQAQPQPPQQVVHQTIIQLGDSDRGHIIHQADDKTIIIKPIEREKNDILTIEQHDKDQDDTIVDDFTRNA